MLKNIRSYFYKYKSLQHPLEKYVFPVLLFFYPFIGLNFGLDITDTTYSLANYEFIDKVNPMWLLSIFISNMTGNLMMKLPGAGTMLGFSVYATLIICLIALVAYYCLQDYMPGWMIFIGLFIAESLCWCPRVIMYNYLTYLFFTLGTLFLLKGLFEWQRQGLFLFLAGVMLGLNVMVRFPNLVEAAMILVLWFYAAITHADFPDTVKKTLICIGGYIAGFAAILLIICVMHGPTSYFEMIGSLFGMTKGASDYTTSGMLSWVLESYRTTASHMLLMIPCVMAGIIMFLLVEGRLVWLKKLAFVAGLLILLRYYYGKGVITCNYFYYDSVFQLAMMFVIISLVLGITGSTGVLNGSRQEQTIAFAIVMIILITPIGSNNNTYPIINNLFIVAPISLWLMRRLMQRLGERDFNFAWQSTVTVVILALMIQGFLFHLNFSFIDGADGTIRDTKVENIAKARGMITSEYNVDSLEELQLVLKENGLMQEKTILFGGIPGISYLFDLEPAIDSVWPDLDSYSTEVFNEQLVSCSVSSPLPTVIIGNNMAEYDNIQEKYDILLDYIANHDYNKVFESDRFTVFVYNSESEEQP